MQLLYSDRKHKFRLEMKRGQERWIIKGHKETFRVIDMFVIFIVARVSDICQNISSYIHFKHVQFIVHQSHVRKSINEQAH